MFKSTIKLVAAWALALAAQGTMAQGFNAGIPTGWNCVGICGTLGADGVVTLAPGGGTQYGYVVTRNEGDGGILGVSPFNLGSETTGSTLRSAAFGASANDPLNFKFNFVGADGAGFADLAWARLLNANDLTQIALLFTARTNDAGDIVPGFGLPQPDATLNPDPVAIILGTEWSPLAADSGGCFSTGCGHSGWIDATYNILNAGDYILEFGVVNWGDQAVQAGMAFDGITVAGQGIGNTAVPEPATLAILAAGLGLIGGLRRRRR